MSKHTPWPWKVRKTFYEETYIKGKDGYYVFDFPVCSPNEKDVVMIAAAPEMEAWIRAALKQFEEQAQVIINHGSIIDDADKFKEEPIVKLILSGRDILSRIEEDEAE